MLVFFVSGYQDSNLGPPAPKAGALTGLRYTPRKDILYFFNSSFYVGVPGFEPGTPCSQSRCANRTALHPEKESILLAFVSVSGYQDSNLGPPAPKAGALTGLRYTPYFLKSDAKVRLLFETTKYFGNFF